MLNRCQRKDLKLNADKMQFRQNEVTCLDHVVSSGGLGGDPSKLRAINDIPARKDKQGVH